MRLLKNTWFSFIALIVLGVAFFCLSFGEPITQHAPLFKTGINLIYISFGIFFVSHFRLIRFNDVIAIKWILICLILIIAIAYISVYFSALKNDTLTYIRHYLLEPCLFMMFVYLIIKHTKDIRILVFMLIFIFVLHSLLTIYDYIVYAPPHSFGIYRAMPKLFSEAATGYGFNLLIAMCICISGVICSRYKKTFGVLIVIVFIASICNATRFLILSYMIVLIVPFFILSYAHKARVLIILGIVYVACLFGLLHYGSHFGERFDASKMLHHFKIVWDYSPAQMGRFNNACGRSIKCMPQSFPSDKTIQWEESSLARISMNKSTILGIAQNPLRPNGFGKILFGPNILKIFGPNSDNIPFRIYIKDDGTHIPYYWTNHNGILSFWFELGAIGFIIIICFHILLLYKTYKTFFAKDIYTKSISIGVALLIIGLSVCNLFDNLPNRAGQCILFMIFGIFLALSAKLDSKEL